MTERDEKHKEGFFQKVKHFFSHEKKTDDEYDRSILNPESSKDVNISRPIPTGETLASNTYNKNFEKSNTDVKSRNNQDIIESELDRPETSRVRPISNEDLPGEHYVIHIGDSKAKPTTGITGINEDNLKKGENYGHPVGDSKPLPTPKNLSSNKDYEKTHKKDKYKVGESKPKKNKSGSNLSEKDREYEKTHKKDKYKVGESKPKKNKSGSNLSEKDKRKDKNKLGESVPLSSGFGSNDTHVIKGTNENIVILPVKDENHIILKESKQSELGSDLNQMPTSSRTNDMNQKSPSNMEKMPLQSNINQMPPTQSSNMNQMPITSNMNEMNQNPIPITSGMNQMPMQSNMNQIPPMQSSNMMPPMQSNMNQMPPNLNQMPMQSNMNQMPMNEMNQNPIPIPSGMNQMPMQSNMNQMPITSSNVESSLGETLVVVEKGVGNESDIHIYLNDKNPQSQSQGINDTGKF